MGKKITKFLFAIFLITLLIVIVFRLLDKNKEFEQEVSMPEEVQSFSSNIIKDVKYISSDSKGNRYTITARTGEIDYSDPNTIFLTEVNALIELNNSNNIEIVSDFGKYNTVNFDTIFSKNVIVTYLQNKITSEYVDFSIIRNNMIISKNVVYTNIENIIKADVAEVDLKTKDTKIYMYENNKMVNIKSKNYNGNN